LSSVSKIPYDFLHANSGKFSLIHPGVGNGPRGVFIPKVIIKLTGVQLLEAKKSYINKFFNGNTDKIININDKLTSNTFNVRVVESPRPRNVLSGTQVPTTSPQPLASTSSIILRSGINIKSPITNTSTIFVGSSTIVANTAAAYPLEPGESLFIECDNITSLYCYAIIDVEKQKIIYIGS
jgi:hypothetical protein